LCDALVDCGAEPSPVSALDWLEPWAGATADVLSLDDIGAWSCGIGTAFGGAVSCGIVVEELFGAVTEEFGETAGALDCASAGPAAMPIRASDAAVAINLFMDFTPIRLDWAVPHAYPLNR
jgi:hypothetical protein